MSEHLDIVVHKADRSAPERGEKQQQRVDAVQTADQQRRAEQRDYDDHPAHRGRALFLHLTFEPEVADAFSYLSALQPMYDFTSREEGYEHTEHSREHSPE